MTESSTSVDPRVKRTLKLLQQAFMELFQEKDLASISVQDIAERATVNRATFYAHFTDKFALLDAIIREDLAECLADGDPFGAPDTRAMLFIVAKNVFTFVGKHAQCKLDKEFDPQFERAM